MTSSNDRRPQVAIVYRWAPHYRVPFYDRLRERLADDGIQLRLIIGQPDPDIAERQDNGQIEWAELVDNHYVPIGARNVVWQPCLRLVRGCDLVIVEQASRLLVNYPLLAWRRLGGPKVAFWGHGKNLDTQHASHVGEWIKRRTARVPDWWFCYTASTSSILASMGVPQDRQTVVQNAVDTSWVRSARASLEDEDLDAVRAELSIGQGPVAVSIGSLYPTRYPEYLIAASDEIRRYIDDFELIVIGGGTSSGIVAEAATTRPWLHYEGPQTGQELVRRSAVAAVSLNPGVVGLGVLDAFALGLPVVTRDIPGHGPEYDYLENESNGLVLPRSATPRQYADHVARLLADEDRLRRLSRGASESASRFTLDEMVARFAEGVQTALSRT